MNKILAVVVTYNRKELLRECIQKLKNQTYREFDILIVDNNSNDGTADLFSNDKSVIYKKLDKNIGGAGGFNYGLRFSFENNYDYSWIMDDDTFPSKNALEEFINADNLLKGDYGALSSVVLYKDGKECRMNRQKIKKNFYEDIHLLKYSLVRFEQASFVSLFIPSKTLKEYGLPIKEFFIWGDDIEFTRRLTVRNNINCYIVGKSEVTHYMKDNNGSSIAFDSKERLERYNYAFRNENYLYRKEGIKGFCYYIGKCLLNIVRIIAYSQDNKLKRIWIIIKNMVLGLFFNPKIERISI